MNMNRKLRRCTRGADGTTTVCYASVPARLLPTACFHVQPSYLGRLGLFLSGSQAQILALLNFELPVTQRRSKIILCNPNEVFFLSGMPIFCLWNKKK